MALGLFTVPVFSVLAAIVFYLTGAKSDVIPIIVIIHSIVVLVVMYRTIIALKYSPDVKLMFASYDLRPISISQYLLYVPAIIASAYMISVGVDTSIYPIIAGWMVTATVILTNEVHHRMIENRDLIFRLVGQMWLKGESINELLSLEEETKCKNTE